MTLMFGVGCTGVNQCGPLQVSTLSLGMVRPLEWAVWWTGDDIGKGEMLRYKQ